MKAKLVLEAENDYERKIAVKVSHYFSWGSEKSADFEFGLLDIIEILLGVRTENFRCQVDFPIDPTYCKPGEGNPNAF